MVKLTTLWKMGWSLGLRLAGACLIVSLGSMPIIIPLQILEHIESEQVGIWLPIGAMIGVLALFIVWLPLVAAVAAIVAFASRGITYEAAIQRAVDDWRADRRRDDGDVEHRATDPGTSAFSARH